MFQQYQTPSYAGFWMRFAAYVIDYIVMTMVTCPLGIAFGVAGALAEEGMGGAGGRGAITNAMTAVVYVISLVGTWLYYAISECSGWQATVGKKLLSLRVTDTEAQRIGFGRATARFFARLVVLVPLIFGLALFLLTQSGAILIISLLLMLILSFGGYVMIAFTERKQALHDMIAGTLILEGSSAGGGGSASLNQPPPPPPSDFNQGGYGGGYGTGGGYGGGGSTGGSGSTGGGGGYGGGYGG